jgi:tetratricopeptide (TPR) repeat protein
LLLFSVLYSFAIANYLAFNGDALKNLSKQFLAIAEKQGTAVPLTIGHRLMGHASLLTGDILKSRAHYDQALARYNPAEHRSLALRLGGQDAGVSVLSHRSWALWILGYPEAALADAQRAVKDARDIGQAATLMYALSVTSDTHIYCGKYAAAGTLLDELLFIADQKGSSLWKALGMVRRGWLLAWMGKPAEAVDTITLGLSAYLSTGSTVLMSVSKSSLARAYADLGRIDEAWRCISEPLRHRQPKAAATDMFNLKPPRHISTLPSSGLRSDIA